MRRLISKSNIQELKEKYGFEVVTDITLANISRWKIGGKASCLIKPRGINEVQRLVSYLKSKNMPYVTIGATSNLLFADEGVDAVIIQICSNNMSNISVNDNIVTVQAGVWVPFFSRKVSQLGFSGVEHISGIPGTLGGLVCMNGGSQRKAIGDNIRSVLTVSPSGVLKVFSKKECEFGYRSSIFQRNNHIIAELIFEFDELKPLSIIRNEMLKILRSRREKFPQKLNNCGSTFISNHEMYHQFGPPGKIIEELGYKGYKVGGVEVSTKHANFINNTGQARASDVIELILEIRNKVKEVTGYEMESEVKYVQNNGSIIKVTDLKN